MKKITYLAEEEIKKKFKANISEIDLSDENITRILMVDDFDSLKIFDLSCNVIKKIEGLYLLVNLQKLHFGQNKIDKIEGLDTLANLQVLDLEYNNIKKIEGLTNLVHLKVLLFSYNSIQQMEGLDHLVSLQELNLSNNQIRKIEGLDRLVNLKILNLSRNMIGKIEGLDKLVNLERLYLANNKIRKLEGLDNLLNLQKVDLTVNQIEKIEGLHKLVNLQYLDLRENSIRKIEGLNTLVNLKTLKLSNNQISKLEGLVHLINLHELYLWDNKIIEINDPSQITTCIFLHTLCYDIDVYVHPVIIRFISHNKLKVDNLHIYTDSQNIHDNSINSNITESVKRLMIDIPLKEINQSEIINDPILTEQTKRLLLEFISDMDKHSILLLTFAQLFGIIWQVIQKHPDASTIKEILNQEMNDSICKCFTGRMNRLVNVLNGFDPRVVIKISDSDAISNIIILFQKKYSGSELKDVVHKELIDRGYTDEVIKEWIDFIE